MLMLQASQNTSFTRYNLNPLEQKQPKKQIFSKIGWQENLATGVTYIELM
jgi:hypothetical protein